MKNKLQILLPLFCAVILITSCKKTSANKVADNGPAFSLDKFDAELKASIAPSGAVGWTYIINQNGLFAKGGGFGKMRNTADGPRNMTVNSKINLASVSKFITAIGVMQLLERRNMDPSAKIGPWLPASWSQGTGVSSISFSELLTHNSGLNSSNTNFPQTLCYSCLRSVISQGVTKPLKPNDYLNANYALFRILIPSLWRGLDDAPNISPILDSAATENLYIQYMQEKVFEPVGLTNIDCEPETRSVSTMYYMTSDGDVTPGVWFGSWKSLSGGGGFYMTAMELARLLAYYRHTEVLMPKSQRTIMDNMRFGFERVDPDRELHGTYLPKNGSISDGNGRGVVTQLVLFPNGIEVIVMFNSQNMVFAGGETSIRRAIYDAYNKSWQ